jgi:hypothetical protein
MINDLWLAFVCLFNLLIYHKQLFFLFLGNEDVYHMKWMHLHRGEPKRCYCGHWFKLTERQYVDLSDFGITEEMQKPAAH